MAQRWAHCWVVQTVPSLEQQRGHWTVDQMVFHSEYKWEWMMVELLVGPRDTLKVHCLAQNWESQMELRSAHLKDALWVGWKALQTVRQLAHLSEYSKAGQTDDQTESLWEAQMV